MILSWSSTKPSIWGVALSWKYRPQGLGASQYRSVEKRSMSFQLVKQYTINKNKTRENVKSRLIFISSFSSLFKSCADFAEVLYIWVLVFFLLANSIKLFSSKLIKGTIIKKWEKYKTVDICPNSINGDSTCLAPNCINIRKLPTKIKKAALLKGLNCIPLDLDRSVKGIANNITIAENIAITPSNLLGIDLNIA